MAITVEKALLNNQSILQNFALVEEIDEQAAEIISGGYEVFTIKNATPYTLNYTVDGTQFSMESGSGGVVYTAFNGGKTEFDIDMRGDYELWRSYNLEEGRIYEFQINNYTPGNPYDIDLFLVA